MNMELVVGGAEVYGEEDEEEKEEKYGEQNEERKHLCLLEVKYPFISTKPF